MSTITTFDELAEKQGKEWTSHLKDLKNAFDQQQEFKNSLLKAMNCTEVNLPDSLKDKLVQDKEGFKNDWGLYGRKDKALRFAQQKELDAFFNRQQEINQMKDPTKTPEKEKVR
jgi:hypothetical protein